MMRVYMASEAYTEVVTTLRSSKAVMDSDCNDMLVHFFSGAWYYLSKLQLVLLQNGFQTSNSSRFSQGDAGLMMVFGVANVLFESYGQASTDYRFCLEMRSDDE